MDIRHTQSLKTSSENNGPVIYWMSRDQRVADNWAMVYAQEVAQKRQTYFEVVFCLRGDMTQHSGTARMLDFMLGGLQEVSSELAKLNIPFNVLIGDPISEINKYIDHAQASEIVLDFNPLRIYKNWQTKLVKTSKAAVALVDAHNIVPVWQASLKEEYAAYTLRPKINKLLPEFLTEFPEIRKQTTTKKFSQPNFKQIRHHIKVDESVVLPKRWVPGAHLAQQQLHKFLTQISGYEAGRNDPNQDAQSNLSPYLHFGQLSAQRVVLEARKHHASSFLEEIVVRRELSDNFCHYNSKYDQVTGFPDWAQKSLHEHLHDRREYLYTKTQLEHGQTTDPAWNACQKQLVVEGKMHGYMRMYWAKKLLEWTRTPQEAMDIAIWLNDKYEIDGRDPNGYTGIAWSIGGVHDRPWFDRPIIGKIRSMTKSGLEKKFNLNAYITKYS